jgi:hypothetical protein
MADRLWMLNHGGTFGAAVGARDIVAAYNLDGLEFDCKPELN